MATTTNRYDKYKNTPTRYYDNNIIKLSAINANSIQTIRRRMDLQEFIQRNKIDFALISETKLTNSHKLSFKNHKVVNTDRPNAKMGGGTVIIIHNSSIYAPGSLKGNIIKELDSLFQKFKLDDIHTYHIIAGDLNARHISYGDAITNYRGRQLALWDSKNPPKHNFTTFPASKPTFPTSGSFIDYAIVDSRIEIIELQDGKLTTLPYDSDHNAISFSINMNTIFQGTVILGIPTRYNYKKTNWEKFSENLLQSYKDHRLAHNRNLSINEIDNAIVNLEDHIQKAIVFTVPKFYFKQNYCNLYINNRIKKLHRLKSKLITRLFNTHKAPNNDLRYSDKYIKDTIKLINVFLHIEFKKSITAFWEARIKGINFFFPSINKLLKNKKAPNLEDLKLNPNNIDTTIHNIIGTEHWENNENEIYITNPINKLNIIGKHFENINSPRYTNQGSNLKTAVDLVATEIRNTIAHKRRNNITIATFSNENPAYNSSQQTEQTSNTFHSYIETAYILRKAKNKTSSGIDNILMIVLKQLPMDLIDYFQ
ncbi:hypothetical protein KPH14_011604 [Odynerus spinipes]|uniref:Endonuclease/exonuclease/phosphatase domain-containing protein n=1 Tax=Odynerus spinipes TaxID=1348599 RepID=A0AAD9RDK8_9HYME|nr:hypothetical protein KPH14_011604 [Odynerus spinipes]